MDNYARFNLETVKKGNGVGSFTFKYKHDIEREFADNVDKTLSYQNRQLIPLNGKTYQELYDEKIIETKINGGIQNHIRSNAVPGLSICLGFSREMMDKFDLDEWAKTNLKWLNEYFNPPNQEATVTNKTTGETKTIKTNNVVSAVLHLDESNPHIHAIIVPIDEKGELNASYYNNGKAKFFQYHDSYAKEMKQFGLQRGTKCQKATPEAQRKYYRHINEAVKDTISIEPTDTMQSLCEKANYELAKEKSQHRNDVVKFEQRIREIKSEYLEEKINKSDIYKFEKKIKKLAHELGDNCDELEHSLDTVLKNAEKQRDLKKGIELQKNPEKIKNITSICQEMQRLGHEEYYKRKKKYYEKSVLK